MKWQFRQAIGGASWWVTDGEWKPGHPKTVLASCHSREIAKRIADEHNKGAGEVAKCWSCGYEQPETFGELVKYWRGDKTLKAAGELCGLAGQTIGRIESGELPDMKTYVALVQVIGVSGDFAFDLIRKQLARATDAQIEAAATGAAVQP